MAAVAMLAMNSCEKENEMSTGEQKGTPVEFEMGINSITKTTTADDALTTSFATGDSVGIFVYNGDLLIRANAQYKLNEEGKWVAQGEPIYADEDASYNYYAYYPYNPSATDATSLSLSVATDQTQGYTSSDVLIAKSENVESETTTVTLQYAHAFTMVQVALKGDQAASDATVTLQNIRPTSTINLKTQTCNANTSTPGTVIMKPCTTNTQEAPYNYRAIVPAQTITKDTSILTAISNGRTYKFSFSADLPYESGKLRQINVTIGANTDGQAIEISKADPEIIDWTASTKVDGTGNITEIPYVNPFGSALADAITAPDFAEDTWFGLKQSVSVAGDITYSIEDDATTTWGKAATLSYTSTWNTETKKAVNNSWYLGTLGYYHCSTETPINGGIYRVTMKTKGMADSNNNASKLVFTCRNAKNNASFAITANVENFTATTVTNTPKNAGEWENFTLYIDFSRKSTQSPGGSVTLESANAEDYAKFDLRIYTNNAATADVKSNTAKIYISDVIMEPYVAE